MRAPFVPRTLHRRPRRRSLTVVTFQRVLPEGDARGYGADPAGTIGAGAFRECLELFRRRYAPVALARILAARAGGEPLPDRALHVTFDGGWADTAEVALPMLAELGVPATVFVVSGAVGAREPFWQEQVFAAWSEGRLSPSEAEGFWRELPLDDEPPPRIWGDMADVRRLIARLERLDEEERGARLEARRELLELGGRAAMLSAQGLQALIAAGIEIGSHGRTRRPLTRVSDPEEELRGSRRELAQHLGLGAEEGPRAFAFPHGASSPELEELARACGYELLFTGGDAPRQYHSTATALVRLNVSGVQ